jgi:MFS family permease
MSTFPTVNPLMYGLATAIASLKLFLPVFIGGRLADLGERGGKMDAGTKAINYLGIALSAVLGIGIGWFIYKR